MLALRVLDIYRVGKDLVGKECHKESHKCFHHMLDNLELGSVGAPASKKNRSRLDRVDLGFGLGSYIQFLHHMGMGSVVYLVHSQLGLECDKGFLESVGNEVPVPELVLELVHLVHSRTDKV